MSGDDRKKKRRKNKKEIFWPFSLGVFF